MTDERCPHCGSTNVRHEVEMAETIPPVETASYWVCDDCGEGWTYQEDLERENS